MSGLMRTTSRSESQNSAFHQNTHCGSTLVNFMITFESAMVKQRYTQSSLDFKTKDKFPKMRTPFPIEENASLFYTRKAFRQLQNEMYKSITTCFSLNHNIADHVHEFLSRPESDIDMYKSIRPHGSSTSNRPELDIDNDDDDDKWDKMLRDSIYTKEDTFIKDFNNHELLRRCFRYSDSDESIQKVAIDIFSTVDNCLSSLNTNKERLEVYYEALKELESKFMVGVTIHECPNKSTDIGNRLGVSIPADVQIQNPIGIRNKGSGTKKGLKVLKKLSFKNHVLGRGTRFNTHIGSEVGSSIPAKPNLGAS
uniref:Protein FAR1-RELATED SEQUENCE n=1 Tax=Lactuca sativa TaxID=4236 RepID=A0A9R1V6E2_LACSA|nr:hypothetical protein LSAT_V11C600321060 [Lactuca sativa]